MKQSYLGLEILLAVVLVLGMFPSFTALSQVLYQKLPLLGKYAGPLNPLKIASPLFLYWIFIHHREFSGWLGRLLLVALGVGTLGTFTGVLGCEGIPANHLREWFVMVLGVIASLGLFFLRRRFIFGVLTGWALVVYGAVFLNYVFPSGLNWINAHFFDPMRQVPLRGESLQFLIGFYDVASLGKLLMWMPWVVGFVLWSGERGASKRIWVVFTLIAIASTILALATTQRAPFVAALAGWGGFWLHQGWGRRSIQVVISALAVTVLIFVGAVWVAPGDLIARRVLPLFSTQVQLDGSGPAEGGAPTEAHASVLQRKRILVLTLGEIAHHPFGTACPSVQEYKKFGVLDPAHSHNLILEQFKARGWIWGALHLALWGLAFVGTWRLRGGAASSLLGGVTATIVLGLADHPWFVLNHAMVLGFFLFAWVFVGRNEGIWRKL